jgi:hypothetical protein
MPTLACVAATFVTIFDSRLGTSVARLVSALLRYRPKGWRSKFRESDTATGGNGVAAAFALGQPLPAALLYRRCDPAELPFAVCSELEEAPGPIGQERAVEALEFALRMRRKGYNVYALGPSGSGRYDLTANI